MLPISATVSDPDTAAAWRFPALVVVPVADVDADVDVDVFLVVAVVRVALVEEETEVSAVVPLEAVLLPVVLLLNVVAVVGAELWVPVVDVVTAVSELSLVLLTLLTLLTMMVLLVPLALLVLLAALALLELFTVTPLTIWNPGEYWKCVGSASRAMEMPYRDSEPRVALTNHSNLRSSLLAATQHVSMQQGNRKGAVILRTSYGASRLECGAVGSSQESDSDRAFELV